MVIHVLDWLAGVVIVVVEVCGHTRVGLVSSLCDVFFKKTSFCDIFKNVSLLCSEIYGCCSDKTCPEIVLREGAEAV